MEKSALSAACIVLKTEECISPRRCLAQQKLSGPKKRGKRFNNQFLKLKTDIMKQETILQRLKFYFTPNDGRYEDLKKGSVGRNIAKDLTAGLIVAAVAIPLAMGFAMASGLRPEQGIVGGAVAGLVGALFGGSKYQVYGPTAAFIPVIAGIMATYNLSFLILASLIAGVILMLMGV